MVLLQINSVANWGSTGRIAEEIGQVVQTYGWKSYIMYGRKANPSHSEVIKIGSKTDLLFHGLQSGLFDQHGLGSYRSTVELLPIIKNINPDIIHLHNIHGYYLNYRVLFEYLSYFNKTVVWTFHDCWPFTGHCSYFSSADCYKWETLCNHCIQNKEYPRSWFLDRSKQNFLAKQKSFTSIKDLTIVPVSDWLADMCSRSFFRDYPIKRIYNGIDINVFKPVNSDIRTQLGIQSKFVIIGVANIWDARKGLEDFIELSKRLDENYVLLLIGLTARQIQSLPPNIIGLERAKDTAELAEYYSLADLYINFSKEETFGLTTAESLSCGTPAMVYNLTACPEVISPETGFVIEQNDMNAVLQVINSVRIKGKQYYSADCRKRIVENFKKEDRYQEYFQLYNELIHNNR